MTKYISIIFVCFLLGACSYKIKLDVTTNSECNVEAVFLKALPQIDYVLVAEPKGKGFAYETPVWEIKGNYKKVGKISYGEVPEGFNEVVKSSPLIPGKKVLFRREGFWWWFWGGRV